MASEEKREARRRSRAIAALRHFDWAGPVPCQIEIMGRASQIRHLLLAEGHVAEGDRLISEQKKRVAKLEDNGSDSSEALKMLQTFRDLQELHVARHKHALSKLERNF